MLTGRWALILRKPNKRNFEMAKNKNKSQDPTVPVEQMVRWPKVRQEVEHAWSNVIGTVLNVCKKDGQDVAEVDWGLHISTIKTDDLKEVDT